MKIGQFLSRFSAYHYPNAYKTTSWKEGFLKPIQSPILGEYINLRVLSVDDAAVTFSWRESARASLLNRGSTSVEEQARWIAARPSSEVNLIIETKEHKPVGMISLVGIDERNRHAESARFLIGDETAVRGLPVAVEAMKLLYDLAFITLGLERVHGLIASENKLMIKWQRYLGMKEEGRLRNHYFINDKFQDAVCLGILASEYQGVALPKMKTLISAAKGKTQ